MYPTITVKRILERIGYDIWMIFTKAAILDAARKMADKSIGALLIFGEEEFVVDWHVNYMDREEPYLPELEESNSEAHRDLNYYSRG